MTVASVVMNLFGGADGGGGGDPLEALGFTIGNLLGGSSSGSQSTNSKG